MEFTHVKNRLREYKLEYQISSPPPHKKKKMGGWCDQGEVSVNFIWVHGLNCIYLLKKKFVT